MNGYLIGAIAATLIGIGFSYADHKLVGRCRRQTFRCKATYGLVAVLNVFAALLVCYVKTS